MVFWQHHQLHRHLARIKVKRSIAFILVLRRSNLAKRPLLLSHSPWRIAPTVYQKQEHYVLCNTFILLHPSCLNPPLSPSQPPTTPQPHKPRNPPSPHPTSHIYRPEMIIQCTRLVHKTAAIIFLTTEFGYRWI